MAISTFFKQDDSEASGSPCVYLYTESMVSRLISDPQYGDDIPIYPRLAEIIDTPQFQRLREIKQLGTTSHVWPNATHTRFEHSLGVAFLARKMADHLRSAQPDLGITAREVALVEIAGLCHDLGHGPWSHAWDNLFMPKAIPGTTWTHEVGSETMFDYLIKDNGIQMPLEDQEFVKALIAGDASRTPNEKSFLFDIVANKRNGLDVDKFDYIPRDCRMVGMPGGHSLARLFRTARVIDGQICYDIKEARTIYDFFSDRYNMHSKVYNHKTTKAIEYMIIDALLAAQPHLHLAESVFNSEEYLGLTDCIRSHIQHSKDPELAEARAIFARIPKRNLYKEVGSKIIKWTTRDFYRENVTAERIITIAKTLLLPPSVDAPDLDKLKTTDIIVNFSSRNFGMKEKNPIDFVRFYSKNEPYQCRKANPSEYSSLIHEFFSEDYMSVFIKHKEYALVMKAAYRALMESLDGNENTTS